jgi:hypothetical protein
MINPTADEMARKEAWTSARLRAAKGTELPFSFVYDGQASAELLATWPLQHSTRSLDDRREEHTLSFQDPRTGLLVRCVSADDYQPFRTIAIA